MVTRPLLGLAAAEAWVEVVASIYAEVVVKPERVTLIVIAAAGAARY